MTTERQQARAQAPARVLVHAPNWVGDHAMAFPFYAALRELLPEAELVLIGRRWVSDLAPPWFNEIINLEGKELRNDDLKTLRALRFDTAFTLSPSFRSAWLLKRIGVTRRYGFATDMRSWLLTRPKNPERREGYNRFEHRSLAYLRLLNPWLPAGSLAEELFERFRDVRLEAQPLAAIEKKYGLAKSAERIVICPGSTAASKKYPASHHIRALELMRERHPHLQIVLLGASIDQNDADVILRHFAADKKTAVFSLCGKTTLTEAHALISSARFVVANDSGLAHLTSLTSTPLITFNGMGRRQETGPLTASKVLFDLDLPCSPCFAKVCPRRDAPLECLTGILPESVAEAGLALLRVKRSPPAR